MFGGSFDWAIRSGLLDLPRAKRFWWSGLRDCRCLRVAGDPVCGATQVLPDCHHRHLGVLFWPARTIGWCFIVSQALRLEIGMLPRFPQPAGVDDGRPFGMIPPRWRTVQGGPLGLAGIGLVGQYPPARSPLRPWYQTRGLPARFAGACLDLVDEAFLLRASSGWAKPPGCHLVARRTLRAFFDPPRLRVSTGMAAGAMASMIAASARDPNLTVTLAGRSSQVAKPAAGRLIGHRCKEVETAKQQSGARAPASGYYYPISGH
ncbi:MAG: hypothetical protein GDA36_08145, partial [Rhodobacteraceae bacterium]|nr:hypothetical protein [Paracoccaceae bacterium]